METRHSRPQGQRPVLRFALILVLALAALLLWSGAALASPHAQDVLLQLAATQPETQVDVIVQKTSAEVSLDAEVQRLGGLITGDLHIINAFSAQLPARAIPLLARDTRVRWISLDAPVEKSSCKDCAPTTILRNYYLADINGDDLRAHFPWLNGRGVTVAVVDSGIANHPDLMNDSGTYSRVIARAGTDIQRAKTDRYGHGTHIAGIIAGNGVKSNGLYAGLAPEANLISVQVTDEAGEGMTSDVVRGLQWVLDNRKRYNIRVVNISLNSSVAQSYNVDPLDAAVEILWFNKIVVIVSAGNTGPNGVLYPPANDPFVITVGSVDDKGTRILDDDRLASYSAFATTPDGFKKPDLVAPGQNIVSLLARKDETLAVQHPDHLVNNYYFRMSGTSMASAVTSGAATLLIQSNPALNPDQVKYRLMSSARPFGAGSGAGYLDIDAAVRSRTNKTANTGTPASQLLWTGTTPPPWNSVSWNSVSWTSVSWTSVSWTSVSWTSVSWTSDYWGN